MRMRMKMIHNQVKMTNLKRKIPQTKFINDKPNPEFIYRLIRIFKFYKILNFNF